MAMWCFNRDMLRDALANYAEHLSEEKHSPEFIEMCSKAAVGFLCSEEASKLRVRGEAVDLAPPPVEVEELELEDVESNAITATPEVA